jgi:thiosulfate/3-mercaptopyruvate sulfurtransferase
LLDGGYDNWVNAGYPLETQSRAPKPRARFGVSIPQRPEIIVDIEEAKAILADPEGAALVSVRTWKEHTGQVSGYNYIEPKGRIAGDVWGNCGSDAYHMQHYRNVDNTMRPYPEIAANWAEAGITPDKWVAFYCGT